MGEFVFVAAQQHSTTAGSLTGGHMFWIGVLIGVVVGALFPGWVAFVLAGVAFIGAGLFQAATHHAGSGRVSYLVVGVIALLVGLFFGRARGLRHLGEAEFRTRWRNVRGVSRWI